MSNPLNHNPASGIFATKPPRKRKRKTDSSVPERDPKSEFKPNGPPVSFREKDVARERLLAIYGPQEEFRREKAQ